MAGAFTEFGRKSTGYKVGVFVAIGVVLGLVYWKAPLPFGYKKAKASLAQAKEDNDSALATSAKLDKDAKDYKKKLAEADELNRIIEENQKALPTEAELPAFFDTLGRKVAEAGVQVKRWDYLKEVPTETYIKVPIEVEIAGTFYQMKRFFASLVQRDPVPVVRPDGSTQVEERERIVTIENLQLFDPKVKNRELMMTAKFTASTFRQEAEAAKDDKDKDKDKAKPGAGSGAGSGSAAMPPANTPAGAKARVEDALDKSEQRVGSGSGAEKLKEGVP